MKLNSFEEVKRLTQEMVAIPSINKEPKGETAVAKYIYDYYMGLDYFKEYPERVKMFQTKNDFVERHSTCLCKRYKRRFGKDRYSDRAPGHRRCRRFRYYKGIRF